MITNNKHSPVQTNINNQQEMAINMTAAAFNAILEKLYNDPLSSTIREVTTNAIEAQILSKTNKKILFQVPSALEPNMIIRDFGTGLDDKEINKYLNCLFSTSKSGSNELPGGYGSGSKSPLALVDSFNIVSYKDGISYFCLWFKKDGNLPVLTILSQEETEEENGLKIVVPLASKMKGEYRQEVVKAIRSQLLLFSDRIDFVKNLESSSNINDEIFPEEVKPYFKGELDSIKVAFTDAKNGGWRTYPTLHVSVGDVIYPVPDSIVSMSNFDCPRTLMGNETKQIGFIIDIPIGSLDIAPSRESIMVTETNKNTVIPAFRKVLNALNKDANKPLDVFKASKDINNLKEEDDKIVTKYSRMVLPSNIGSLESRNEQILDSSELWLLSTGKGRSNQYGNVGYNRVRIKFQNHLNKGHIRDTSKILYCCPSDVNKTRYTYYSSQNPDVIAFSSAFFTLADVTKAVDHHNKTYGLISNEIVELVTDVEVTAAYEAYKVQVKANRINNTVTSISNFGGIEVGNVIGYPSYFITGSTFKVRKQYDSAGKEIPFSSYYLTSKNIFLIENDTSLPINVPTTNTDLSSEFTDYQVVHVQERYMERVKASLEADKTLTVYTADNKYDFKSLDVTDAAVYTSNDYIKSLVFKYLKESLFSLLSSRLHYSEQKNKVLSSLSDTIFTTLEDQVPKHLEFSISLLTPMLKKGLEPVKTKELYPVELNEDYKNWIDKSIDLIPAKIAKDGQWKDFAKSVFEGDIYSYKVCEKILETCDFKYEEFKY